MTPTSSEPRIVDQFNFEVFWEQHGQKIMTGLLVLIALGGGAFFWQRHAARQAEAAATRLATAQDAGALELLAQEYAGKEIGAQALLRQAEVLFRNTQYGEALRVYDQFLQQYPRHPFAPTALLGQATVLEAQGNYAAAKDQYLRLAGEHGNNYARTAARLGAARCAELLGQLREARQLYEETLAAAQGTPWESEAYTRWVVLGRELPPEPPAPAATNTPAESGPLTPPAPAVAQP